MITTCSYGVYLPSDFTCTIVPSYLYKKCALFSKNDKFDLEKELLFSKIMVISLHLLLYSDLKNPVVRKYRQILLTFSHQTGMSSECSSMSSVHDLDLFREEYCSLLLPKHST
jgi:hypothetical protein